MKKAGLPLHRCLWRGEGAQLEVRGRLGVGEVPAHAAFVGGFIIVSAVIISIFGDRWLSSRKAQAA